MGAGGVAEDESSTVRGIGRLRSLLFAPAVRRDFIERLPERGADGVVIDCEDATPPGAKDEARRNARSLAPRIAGRGSQVFVRVNAVPSPWFAADMREGLCDALTGIVLPKLERLDQMEAVEAALAGAALPELRVLAGIETALGVADARALLAHPLVAAAYFGAEDFVADMGGVRSEANQEVLYARSRVALAGRLAGVATLDQVVVDIRDGTAFEREVREARAMGYGGKLCIHPAQVAIANRGFMPSAEEIDHARRLLTAYDRAAAEGLAAIDFEGQMVDEPLAARARRILATAAEGEGT
jgi:citrate lyase subunit beta/citryl-CoA lyase